MQNNITQDESNLNMVKWFIKHNISTNVTSLNSAISRALDSKIELL